MRSSTLKFSIIGNTHYEIMNLVEEEITSYLGDSSSTVSKYVNYEVIVEKIEDGKYNASVIARIKDDNR